MFLKRFFEPSLAQTSYLIGCVATHEALVIDANRDVEQYVRAAEAEGTRIKHVTETHIHADFVSGSRELAGRTDARLYLSDEGDADWRYAFAADPNVTLVKHGDRIVVGNVVIEAVHTPGHTPEHLSFFVTDCATANEPIGAATGDFLFVGDVGRPDLLERAANLRGTMELSARALYASLQAMRRHPDWLQVWPGHGAGSACGKGISAIPQSTLGYERRFNWAFQAASEEDFVRNVLAGQPEPPKYFARMKQINKEGPATIQGFRRPPRFDSDALAGTLRAGALVVDTRPAHDFAIGHVPGSISIPLNHSFTTWAGWLIPYDRDFSVIVEDAGRADAAARECGLIGLDRLCGYFDASALDAWAASGRPLQSVSQIEPADLAESLRHQAVTLIDVRGDLEWENGHIAGARHIALGYLADRLDEIPLAKPVVVQCQSGSRSSIAAGLLQTRGYDQVINLAGGISAWIEQGRAVK